MLNSEPQTYVITSETQQGFVLLSDFSKKKGKKGQQFFQGGARTTCTPPVTSLNFQTAIYDNSKFFMVLPFLKHLKYQRILS